MKVTIVTCLTTKRNVDVDTCHRPKIRECLSARSILSTNMSSMRLILIGLCFFYTGLLLSQSQWVTLHINSSDDTVWERYGDTLETLQMDSVDEVLQRRITDLQKDGYFEAAVDSLICGQDICKAEIHIGIKYEGFKLKMADSLRFFFSPRIHESFDMNDPMSFEKWTELRNQMIEELGNTGFPLATVALHIESVKDEILFASVKVDTKTKIVFNKLTLVQGDVLSEKYLRHYLQWEKQADFDESIVNQIKKRINNLDIVRLVGEPEVKFTYNYADLTLNLEKRPSNQFDFLLGVLPGQTNTDRDIIFSVYLNAVLKNMFGRGETMAVRFVNTRPETQELNLNLDLPYFVGMPFGFQSEFELWRNTDVNLNLKYGVQGYYQPKPEHRLGLYYRGENSSILNSNTEFLLENFALPASLDYTINSIGALVAIKDLDFIINPSRGWQINADIALGMKKIHPQDEYLSLSSDSLDVESLYDELGRETQQMRVELSAKAFVPIYGRIVSVGGIQAGWLFNADAFLDNERFRVGGSRTLRGFNEQFFNVDGFAIGTIEMRYSLSRESFLSAFYDIGYLERRTLQENMQDVAHGFGLGMNFQTPIGLFNLSYALGMSKNVTLDLNAGKIHFGYVVVF